MTQITRHYSTECKTPNCQKPVVFHQDSYRKMQRQGINPPAYCESCRKSRRQAQNLFVGYSDFQLNRSDAHTTLPRRERVYQHVDGEHRFDPEKFGVSLEHMLAVFEWFSQPHAKCGVVRGQTGSGKSTAFVYYLLNPPDEYPHDFFTRDGQIWVTQPRIVAAEGISQYIGNVLLGDTFGKGGLIGTRTSKRKDFDPHNQVVMATDGSVLNILLKGQLGDVSMILIDEVHQRSTTIDLIMGLTLYWMPAFPKLKLMVASATIDPEVYQDYMGKEQTAIFDIPGKQPVGKDIIWPNTWDTDTQSLLDYTDLRSITSVLTEISIQKTLWVLDMIRTRRVEHGDILVFFPGKAEIADFLETIAKKLPKDLTVTLHELHAQVSEKQKAVLEEIAPKRVIRLIATTNLTEASLTFKGARHVIDCGLEKQDQWRPEEERTRIVPILTGRSNCKQRWGRVGRTTHGWVYPLYTEEQFKTHFTEYLQPSIERTSLIEARLKLSQAGIPLECIRLLGEPPADELARSRDQLTSRHLIDKAGFITAKGTNSLESDLSSVMDHLLTEAERYGCFMEMASIIPFIRNGGYRNFFAWDKSWHTWTKYQVNELYQTLLSGCKDDLEVFLKIIVLHQADPSQLTSWFINTDTLTKAQEETQEIVDQWSLGKKEVRKEDLTRKIDLTRVSFLRNILLQTNCEAMLVLPTEEVFHYNSWIDTKDAPFGIMIRQIPPSKIFGTIDPENPQEQLFPEVCKPRVTQILELHTRAASTIHEIHPCISPTEIHPLKHLLATMPRELSVGDTLSGTVQEYPLICDKFPIYTFTTVEGEILPLDSSDIGLYCPSVLTDRSELTKARFEGTVGERIVISFLEHIIPPTQEVIEAKLIEVSDTRAVFEMIDTPKGQLPFQLSADPEYFPDGFTPNYEEVYGIQLRSKTIGEFTETASYEGYLDRLLTANDRQEDIQEIHTQFRIARKAQVRKIVPIQTHRAIQQALSTQKCFWDVQLETKNRGGFTFTISHMGVDLSGFLPFNQTKGRGYLPETGLVSVIMSEGNPFDSSAVFRLIDENSIFLRYADMLGYPVTAIAGRYKDGLGQFFHLNSGVSGLVFHTKMGSPVPEGSQQSVIIDRVNLDRKQVGLRLS